MAKRTETKGLEKPTPPTKGLAFLVGLMLFGLILCPAGVFVFYNVNYLRGDLIALHFYSLGCFTGLIIAIIPAFIFMHFTMKKIRQ